jgi:tetratricopeptide (TPR) repeat protein
MKHAIVLTLMLGLAAFGGAGKKPVAAPKLVITPGMKAAQQAVDAGTYALAARLYAAQVTAEEAKPTPSWGQLSFLYNELGLALKKAAQYDKALEYYQKSLAIDLKQLGPGHPSVATSYNNMAGVYYAKKDLAKAKEYMGKAYAILLKKLGPNHPNTKDAKAGLDRLNK